VLWEGVLGDKPHPHGGEGRRHKSPAPGERRVDLDDAHRALYCPVASALAVLGLPKVQDTFRKNENGYEPSPSLSLRWHGTKRLNPFSGGRGSCLPRGRRRIHEPGQPSGGWTLEAVGFDGPRSQAEGSRQAGPVGEGVAEEEEEDWTWGIYAAFFCLNGAALWAYFRCVRYSSKPLVRGGWPLAD
jgi:hypothetical protein